MSTEARTIDPYKSLQITPNPDGTLTRSMLFPDTPPAPDLSSHFPVLSKDVAINSQDATWARVYIPRDALDPSTAKTNKKLPLVVYIHGGGFVLLSVATSICHDFCFSLAGHLSVAVVSVEYRLAPEHRLPAAYDDAVEALRWIGSSDELWLKECVDFSQCYVMGSSAGGNIAYNAGLRVVGTDLGELKIRGLILHHPFFGGVKRSESESRMVNDPYLPLCVADLMWELSLPVGADRDHEFCNPTVGNRSKRVDEMRAVGLKVLVLGCFGDPLVDRQMELVKLMENKGVKVVRCFIEGGYHGLEIIEFDKAKVLLDGIKDFIDN